MSLDWSETYDDNSNTVYVAPTYAYTDGFMWKVNPIVIDNKLQYTIEDSSSELLPDPPYVFESVMRAMRVCEKEEQKHINANRMNSSSICMGSRILEVSDDVEKITITIPTDYVAHIARSMETWQEELGGDLPINDEVAFAKAVAEELRKELSDDGTTRCHQMLDDAINAAIDNGAEGIDSIAYDAMAAEMEQKLLEDLDFDYEEDDEDLESLEDHNKRKHEQYVKSFSEHPHKNGLACPKCGAALIDTTPNMVLASHPPRKNIACTKCDYKGYRIT